MIIFIELSLCDVFCTIQHTMIDIHIINITKHVFIDIANGILVDSVHGSYGAVLLLLTHENDVKDGT